MSIMQVVIAIALVQKLLTVPIMHMIGHSGAAIIRRMTGIILASVTLNSVLSEIVEIIKTGQL